MYVSPITSEQSGTLPRLYVEQVHGSALEPEYSDGAMLLFDREGDLQVGDIALLTRNDPARPKEFKRVAMDVCRSFVTRNLLDGNITAVDRCVGLAFDHEEGRG